MAMFDVIRYEGPNDVFVWKHPAEDFNTKSQLIVHESQEAVFFKDGQALDLFGAGRYTLDTQNIPLIGKLINLPFGGVSPFHCEVYFINKVHSMDIRWGTSNHMPIQDPVYGVILPVGANGQFAIQIDDSRKFLVKMVGTIREFNQQTLMTYFKGILMTKIKDYIAKQMTEGKLTFLEVHAHLQSLSDGIADKLAGEFEEYGIKLVNFFVNAIIIPEDDPSYVQLRKALAKKAEMNVIGFNYQQERTFDVLEGAAKNEGTGSAVMGAGLGMGMGVNLGGFISQAFGGAATAANPAPQPNEAQQTKCTSCGELLPQGAKFCMGCGNRVVQSGMIVCPACGKTVAKAKFCIECGKNLSVSCPKCGQEIQGNGKFCPNCGEKI